MITKPEQHDIDRAGKRLLREVMEQLGWVVNDVQEDYAIDSNVQVFDAKYPTGAWFHVQLKSSASSGYSADASFVSENVPIDHARHYALEMRQPIMLIHADVVSKRLFWCAPQLDHELETKLAASTETQSVVVRIPTQQSLPKTAPDLLKSLDGIYLALATRELMAAPNQSFADSLKHLPDQEAFFRSFQEKGETIKLSKIADLFKQGKFDEAKVRAAAMLADPDANIDAKFWAQIQLRWIDYSQVLATSQSEAPSVNLRNAKELQQLVAAGPGYLKFYALIARKAAELEVLVQEHENLFLAERQHVERGGDPMMALGLYARRSVITARIVRKYNQSLRLARYAANYPDRWMLGRALSEVINPVGHYLVTLRAEGKSTAAETLAKSALQICKLSVSICTEVRDSRGIVLALISGLLTVRSEDSDAYRWAVQVAEEISDANIRSEALNYIEKARKRWKGETVAGDYDWDSGWEIVQKMAKALGIDISNESSPLVRGLRLAVKDNSPEGILASCEHILVIPGAMGPIAREILRYFNLTTAGSKVVHCTLHNFHFEAKEQEFAYSEFKRRYCESCPDRKPRPEGWRYTEQERSAIKARHNKFVPGLVGTPYAMRSTDED